MIADFFTKPLQGSLFKKMRGIIMGTEKLPVEERVEISENNGNATDKLSCANDTLKKIEIKDNDKYVLDVNGLRRKDSRGFGKRVRMIPVLKANE